MQRMIFSASRIVLLTMISMTACAEKAQQQNPLIGTWARDRAECKNPELSFAMARATIATDADGEPVSFEYSGIHYDIGEHNVVVHLGKQHPYDPVAGEDALDFKIANRNTIALKQLQNTTAPFVRCN